MTRNEDEDVCSFLRPESPNRLGYDKDAAKKGWQRALESNRGHPLECAVPGKRAVLSYLVTASSKRTTDREDDGITFIRNVGSYTLNDTASYLRRFKFPTRPDYIKGVRIILQTILGCVSPVAQSVQ